MCKKEGEALKREKNIFQRKLLFWTREGGREGGHAKSIKRKKG